MHVLLADDHSIVRTALKYILAELTDDLSVVEAKTFDEARGQVTGTERAFDLVMLDLRMPGLDGLDDIRDMVGIAAPSPVAVFTVSESPDEMRAVLACGVRAYIPKSTDDSLIAAILQLVIGGGTYVPPVLGGIAEATTAPPILAPAPAAIMQAPPAPVVQAQPMPVVQTPAEPSLLDALTPRQRDVLVLVAEGLSNQEIGARLGLNLSTVKSHVTAILKTLSADNRTQAVLKFQTHSPG